MKKKGKMQQAFRLRLPGVNRLQLRLCSQHDWLLELVSNMLIKLLVFNSSMCECGQRITHEIHTNTHPIITQTHRIY